ncbi:MAG: hypothetical protein KDD37_09960 [Bdellovibrionales bacterium]|nr:hypothetical protein [Bdellovibrionales bacterium]
MEDIFANTKDFLEGSPACRQGMECLNDGAKISIVLEPNFICELKKSKDTYSLEKASSHRDSDVVLRIHPDALKHFLAKDFSNLSDLGIEIIKEIFVGRIHLQVVAKSRQLVQKGYLKLPLAAGAPFLSYLASLGLNRMTKIFQWIEVLRKKGR